MRYRAFISYASSDRAIGERFQREIEHYRIPRVLRGANFGFGPVPKRLTPLFRDRSDASAGRDLGTTLHTALEASDALVVLCSPTSARSRWVNEEIRTFKRLGRNARIFPVLVVGQSRKPDAELAPEGAFPPALFERYDASGARIEGEEGSPLAPDLRENGNGLHFARLKVVAALTGIPLTLLTQRQHEAERRERLIVRGVAVAMAFLAISASVAAVQAWRSAEDARARLEDAVEIAARRVDDAARYQDAYGVPTPVIHHLLSGAERDFDELVYRRNIASPTLQLQRGRLSARFADHYGSVGDNTRQLRLAREAVAAIDGVPTERRWLLPSTWLARLPTHEDVVGERLAAIESLGTALDGSEKEFANAQAVYEQGLRLAAAEKRPLNEARLWSLIGVHRYNGGDLAGSLDAQQEAIAILEKEIERDAQPGGGARREHAIALSERAEMQLELERHREALAAQTVATAEFQSEAASSPGDASAQQRLAQALVRKEDMRYAVTGDWRPSLDGLRRAVGILQPLHDSDPAHVMYARDLSIAQERLGDALLQTGDATEAAPWFERAQALKRAILARDPNNAAAQRDLAVALERQGELALARGNVAVALTAFDEALVLRSPDGIAPARADPVLVRDLAVLWSKVGQARARAGIHEDWGGAFQQAIGLMRPQTERDGAPPGWLRDLAVFHAAYGDAFAHAGDPRRAAFQWNAALGVVERQLVINPDDPRLSNDARILRANLARTAQR